MIGDRRHGEQFVGISAYLNHEQRLVYLAGGGGTVQCTRELVLHALHVCLALAWLDRVRRRARCPGVFVYGSFTCAWV